MAYTALAWHCAVKKSNIPSSNVIAPAKTNAAYSPTSYPATDIQFAIACIKHKKCYWLAVVHLTNTSHVCYAAKNYTLLSCKQSLHQGWKNDFFKFKKIRFFYLNGIFLI